MKRRSVYILFCTGLFLCAGAISEAGIRGPGKYCGFAIFDRWDACTLYSGIYVMYVSEKVKDGLRPYAGQCVQIDAKEVDQPINPGDGLIRKFEYLGKAPENRNWVRLEGIHLRSSVNVREDKVLATIIIENDGKDAVKLFSQELALTLLAKRDGPRQSWSVADGPSFALITRQSLEIGSSEPRWEGKGVVAGKPYSWTVGKENALRHDFTLGPKESKRIDIQFDLPDGEYDFLCGYGGGVHEGKCVASNLSAFDVKEGKGGIVQVQKR